MDTRLAQYHYLIIDDDSFTLQCLKSLMGTLGVRHLVSKADGAEAVESLERGESRPDIIICDLNMPEVDGVEFILQLAKRRFTGGIILISGTSPGLLGVANNLAKAHSLNVLGTMKKPLMRDELIALLSLY